jgi:mRNA-degrading endonuclease RelE of RelBE toxin-antitoxin system
VGVLSGPSSGIIGRAPRDVLLFDRAVSDLRAIQAVERRVLVDHIDKLAMDALPRGVEALEGRYRDHLRLRVGRFRILYKVVDAELTVVAVLAD